MYAECDYAHVFIELPISELINRTDNVYNLFLERTRKNNSDENVKWVPAWMEVKMHAMLEHKARNGEKFGRDISFNIDPVGMINAFFSGINNWIHASSISELREQLDDLAHELKGIKAVEQVFSVNQVRLAQAMADYINGTEILYETNYNDLLLWLLLDELQEALLAVVMASGDLAW